MVVAAHVYLADLSYFGRLASKLNEVPLNLSGTPLARRGENRSLYHHIHHPQVNQSRFKATASWYVWFLICFYRSASHFHYTLFPNLLWDDKRAQIRTLTSDWLLSSSISRSLTIFQLRYYSDQLGKNKNILIERTLPLVCVNYSTGYKSKASILVMAFPFSHYH